MNVNRREFLTTGAAAVAGLAGGVSTGARQKVTKSQAFSGKCLGTIFNNDINNILHASSGTNIKPEEYQRAVYAILDMKPGVLAQNVGMPDPVIYRTSLATTWDKYHPEAYRLLLSLLPETHEEKHFDTELEAAAMKRLLSLGTDPLTLTIEAARSRRVPIVASYRMNSEEFGPATMLCSDFERQHQEWRIPGAYCLDLAVPEVYALRTAIFREVAERYDIDGIEFDWRRQFHMVSDPLKNHTVLTRMVRETRAMLDETARKKGRQELILGVRVGPALDSEPSPFVFPGIMHALKPQNASCKELGLDVKTWIAEGLVDYVCPSLFNDGLPSRPKTREFAELAKNSPIGIYPTVFPQAAWMEVVGSRQVSLDKKDAKALAIYKGDLCTAVLRLYEEGADGISTFNWFSHLRNARMPVLGPTAEQPGAPGSGTDAVQTYIYPLLKDPSAVRRYRDEPWAVPPRA